MQDKELLTELRDDTWVVALEMVSEDDGPVLGVQPHMLDDIARVANGETT